MSSLFRATLAIAAVDVVVGTVTVTKEYSGNSELQPCIDVYLSDGGSFERMPIDGILSKTGDMTPADTQTFTLAAIAKAMYTVGFIDRQLSDLFRNDDILNG